MKKIILSGIITCFSLAIFAQNNTSTWTTDARTALFREGEETLTKKEPDVDPERQSTIAIKYANAITAKYTSTQWAQMSEMEIKKIKKNVFAQSVAAADKEAAIAERAHTHTSPPK